MTVLEAFDDFLLDRQARGCVPRTLSTYREQCLRFIRAYGGKNVEDLTQGDITRFLAQVNTQDTIKGGTKSSTVRSVKIFLRWLVDECGASINVKKIKVPRMPKKDPPIYTADDFMRILEAVNNSDPWIQLRDIASIALMYDCGLRRAEVCGIKRTEFLRCGSVLTVIGKGNKTRKVKIGDTARAYVMAYLDQTPYDSQFLFTDRYGNPWTPQALTRMVYRLNQKLPFKITAHLFRHNFATNFYLDSMADGKQVDPLVLQTLMGHESLQTTMIYMHQGMEEFAALSTPSHLDRLCKK